MAKWLVADSLYCPEAFFASHLDSYSHFLREFGETVAIGDVSNVATWRGSGDGIRALGAPDVLFALDKYDVLSDCPASIKVAQVAAVCDPMPWNVREADGSPVYDLILSSLHWMVDEARKHGCRAEWMPLCFDHRALVAGMGVKERDIPCLFVGTTGGNHVRRTQLLEELKDVVTVAPPTFGREMFRLLARARSVLNIHADWAKGEANNMRCFETTGMGAELLSDGENLEEMWPEDGESHEAVWKIDQDWGRYSYGPKSLREYIAGKSRCSGPNYGEMGQGITLTEHTYIQRVPELVALVRSL